MVPRLTTRQPPAPPARDVLVSPILAALPPLATDLHMLMTVSPDARVPRLRQVREGSDRLDESRGTLMARLTELSATERPGAIRIAQSASLLGHLMVACARVATQGRSPLHSRACADRSREVVELTERAARAGFPVQRRGSRTAGRVRYAGPVLRHLDAASTELDLLMDMLTTERPLVISVWLERQSPPGRPPR